MPIRSPTRQTDIRHAGDYESTVRLRLPICVDLKEGVTVCIREHGGHIRRTPGPLARIFEDKPSRHQISSSMSVPKGFSPGWNTAPHQGQRYSKTSGSASNSSMRAGQMTWMGSIPLHRLGIRASLGFLLPIVSERKFPQTYVPSPERPPSRLQVVSLLPRMAAPCLRDRLSREECPLLVRPAFSDKIYDLESFFNIPTTFRPTERASSSAESTGEPPGPSLTSPIPRPYPIPPPALIILWTANQV